MNKSFEPIHSGDEVVRSSKQRASAQNKKPKASKGSKGSKGPKGKRPSAASIGFLNVWHGLFSGGFFVAMLTGRDFYDAHVFSGVLVIFAIVARVLVGTMFPPGHILVFPFPSFKSLSQGTNGFRRFVSHLMGLTMLMACVMASLTGWFTKQNVDIHAAVSYMTLALIGGHIVLVIIWQGWKNVESKFSARG